MGTIPADKSINTGSFEVRVSPDHSKVLVHTFYPREKDVVRKTRMEMFDGNMNPLWAQDMDMPYTSDEFRVLSQRVDDDGSMVMLGIRFAKKEEKRELKRASQATYEYHLLVFDGRSSLPEDYPIVVEDKFLQDMTIRMGTEGDVLCAGLYGNQGDTRYVSGAFFLRLDHATKKLVHQSYKAFPADFVTSYMTERQAAKAEKKAERKNQELERYEYDVRDLVRRDDGGIVLLAEQYYMYTTESTVSTGNGGTTTRTVYHYLFNDIIAVNIDPNGEIEWAVKVPKRQHTVNTYLWSSFALAVKDDHIYLVFNDSGDNLFLKPGDKVKQFGLTEKNILVVLVTIDKYGEVTREALFSPERRDVILRPMDCVQLDNGSMFIYASRKNDYRFGQVLFK